MQCLNVLELCAGAGGQAIGLERAGFAHAGLVDNDEHACATLRTNRPDWNVIEGDLREFDASGFRGVDLVAGGVPCPPFSVAGKQLGPDDSRDLFPTALKIIEIVKPAVALIENVPGLASARFAEYRKGLAHKLWQLGYEVEWQILNACQYGVPQLRPRFVLVAFRRKYSGRFEWPKPIGSPPTVGDTLIDLMGSRGWAGAENWANRAKGIAPTLVGGSKRHGGPDLGPTRSRVAWQALGVDGRGLADAEPSPDFPFGHDPRLTVRMAARIQGFPDRWQIVGKKTASYRQVGNAFPPPVAQALGVAIFSTLAGLSSRAVSDQTNLFQSKVG